MEEGESSRV